MKNSVLSLLILAFFFSCSKKTSNDPPEPPTITPPTLTTEAAASITANAARMNGTLLTTGGGAVNGRGVCWAANANPTMNDNYKAASGSGTGSFFVDVTNLEPNTTYHVRAYATNDYNTGYGNDITFTTRPAIEPATSATINITTKEAILRGNIASTHVLSVTKRGFCYSTNPNPTLTSNVLYHADGQLNDFQLPVSGLQLNTTYYVKSFAYVFANQVFYGNEVSFKTVGPAGTSGGYIFYDKGEVSDGWRYLESAPADISFSGAFTTKWGCAGSLTGNTSTALGKGLENTNKIIAACADANCAARLCDNYSVNGLTDWFLGSADEMGLLYNATSSLVTYGANQVYWTSSEFNASNAINFNMIFGSSLAGGVSKSNNGYVRAIRRY